MDAHKILAQLYEERDQIDAAIAALDRMAEGRGQRRRGRPPKWLKEARGQSAPAKPKGKSDSKSKKE